MPIALIELGIMSYRVVKIDNEDNVYGSSFGSDWRLLETDADKIIFYAVLEYMYGSGGE